jgi:2-phosphosulfolactate phosphatase
MQIDVVANIGEARSDDLLHKTVIVIDVLRATSTIITALENGCVEVAAVETVIQAKEQQRPGDLLGGERSCRKIPGFDFGNSPLEYIAPAVQGKRIILTTTNGTRGIQKAIKAEHVLACALINGHSCAKSAFQLRRDVVILCAGTQDLFSLEDGLCAGLLIEEFTKLFDRKNMNVNDFGLAMHSSFLQEKSSILAAIQKSSNGKRLNKIGFQADVEYCSRLNVSSIVPILQKGVMVPIS